MTLLRKLLGLKPSEPAPRVRICVECGMPVGEHKEWCTILRGRQELELRRAAAQTAK